jgi:hypothetical protein
VAAPLYRKGGAPPAPPLGVAPEPLGELEICVEGPADVLAFVRLST